MMDDFLLVFSIALLAAFLTYLGAPLAERLEVPHSVVSGALQFAAGIITALVALSLMPPAVRGGPPVAIALMFFIGGAVFVIFEYYSAQKMAARAAETGSGVVSIGLYVGILIDLVIDGIVIGIGATLTLMTGLLLALGMAISTLPLAFVTTSTAKRQGVSPQNRRRLSIAYFACVLLGAMLGFLLLRNAPLGLRFALIALASGFLLTTVTQSMIPEANKEGEPSFAGILYLAGMSIYAILTLTVK
jgi:ZIP family zinc transporter